MTIGSLYWLLMILVLVLNFAFGYPADAPFYRRYGFGFVLWFLLFLIGWKIFGFPIKG